MNNENTRALVSVFSKKQKLVWCCCPRCGADRMSKDASRNALSRRADIMVCDICGNIEAIEDIPGNPKLTMEQWALIEHPERFFLKGKDYQRFYFTFGSWKGFPFQNAYVVVEGLDRADAIERFRRHFPDKNKGIACYSFDYDETAWKETVMASAWPCAGVLRLNGLFEEAE